MFLTNMNLIKIFILFSVQSTTDITIKDTLAIIKRYGIEDVSTDLLYKTIKTLVDEGFLSEKDGKYLITNKGCCEYKRCKDNLLSIVQLLFKPDVEINEEHQVPNVFSGIKAFKTVPYRIDAFGGMNAEDFFKTKIQNPYIFGNRGLGKARLNIGIVGSEYCYDTYAILFFNAGLVQFVGIVDSYDNNTKQLQLSQIIKIKSPITILEIRENVREDFNGAQQKQEFFEDNEVKAVIDLIETKISQFGCDVYDRDDKGE